MSEPKSIESETRGGSCAPAPCSAIPCATEQQKRTGWTIQTNLVDDITVAVNAIWEDTMSMEQTEQVILELAKRGYVVVAGSPNDRAKRHS